MKSRIVITLIILSILFSCKEKPKEIPFELSQSQKQEIIKDLDLMLELDQKYRTIFSLETLDAELLKKDKELRIKGDVKELVAFKNTVPKTLTKFQVDSIRKLQQIIDFDNYKKMNSIIKEYGFPSKERLGVKENLISIFLVHPPSEIEPRKYLKDMSAILLKEVKAERMQAIKYVSFYDNITYKILKEPQLYGTNQTFNSTTRKLEPAPIENIKKTNNARKKLGLPPLKEGEYHIKK